MNPYYDSDKLKWKMIEFDEPDMSYEFNTLCFWITPDNRVFSAVSAGCSCPTPFEDYEGKTAVEIEQKLERVGSRDQALRIFQAWNKRYDGKPFIPESEFRERTWIFAEIFP